MATGSGRKITRRDFPSVCVGAVALGATGLDSVIQAAGTPSTSPLLGTTAVDQNPIRRRGTGLRALDATRASPGLTLFAPVFGDGTVYLIDLQGKVTHTWRMPYPPGLYGYLTEKSTFFYTEKSRTRPSLAKHRSKAARP
jgi:hypothetical protein